MDRTKAVVAPAAVRGRRALFVRRGLVALAAGVLAGVSTKLEERTAEAANGETLFVGNTGNPGAAQTSTSATQIDGNVASGLGTLRITNSANRAIYASTTSSANAIRAESSSGAAIFATSTTNAGLWGEASNSTGLIGKSVTGTGMFAQGGGSSPGIYGVSSGGPGVRGDGGYDPNNGQLNGNTQPAVLGNSSGTGPGVTGTSGNGMGTRGESTNNTGVFGVSSVGIGVHGTTTSGVALRASGRSELYGDVEIGDFEDGNPNKPVYNLNVTGNLQVAGQKSAIVKGADGSYRLFYCLESPESYFEDFGTVKLSGGFARVAIEKEFRQFVAPERGFYIQLTPLGPSNSLFVSSKDATGFEITESNGGKSEIEVQYRIVARRGDVPGGRLARVNPSERRQHERKVKPINVDEHRRTEVAPRPTLPPAPAR